MFFGGIAIFRSLFASVINQSAGPEAAVSSNTSLHPETSRPPRIAFRRLLRDSNNVRPKGVRLMLYFTVTLSFGMVPVKSFRPADLIGAGLMALAARL